MSLSMVLLTLKVVRAQELQLKKLVALPLMSMAPVAVFLPADRMLSQQVVQLLMLM